MKLYVIRHAIAEERRPDLEDTRRALTAEGQKRFRREVRGLRKLGVRFETVYHSPWLRAAQTADLMGPVITGHTEVTPYMAGPPGGELLELLEGECVAVVGHEPWVSELTALLLHGDGALSHSLAFKKGGVAQLEGEARPGGMVLRGFYSPRHLRGL